MREGLPVCVAVVAADAAHARLLELLNASRREAGLAPVQAHDGLARISEAHTRDMAPHGFFGHVSPTSGDPRSRVRAAGLRFSIVAENVGIGVALRPQEGRDDVIATELFARIAPPINVATAPSELLARLNAARRRNGAPRLASEPALADAASGGAS